jgi:hypothetical protein
MRSFIAVAVAALVAQAMPGMAQTGCDTKSAQKSSGTSTPAATGNDGAGATGWTGGTGGNMAGIESQKKSPPSEQPKEAKGLDLKMETKPKGKC